MGPTLTTPPLPNPTVVASDDCNQVPISVTNSIVTGVEMANLAATRARIFIATDSIANGTA